MTLNSLRDIHYICFIIWSSDEHGDDISSTKTVTDISPLLHFVIIVLCTKSVSLKSRGSIFSSLFLACLRRCGKRYILRASDINQRAATAFLCAVGSRDFQKETPSSREHVLHECVSKEEIPKKLRDGRILREHGINQRGSTLSRFLQRSALSSDRRFCVSTGVSIKGKERKRWHVTILLRNSIGEGIIFYTRIN